MVGLLSFLTHICNHLSACPASRPASTSGSRLTCPDIHTPARPPGHTPKLYIPPIHKAAHFVINFKFPTPPHHVLQCSQAGDGGLGSPKPLRVVPLFETLDDLDAGGKIMKRLFELPWWVSHIVSHTHIVG